MRTETGDSTGSGKIRLADYRAPDWLIDETRLVFDLDPDATRVRATIRFRRNPERAAEGPADLALDGRALKLIAAAIDGRPLAQEDYALGAEGLRIPAALLPRERFVWTCETQIAPAANTALEGLYMSGGGYCTQCEAQGFRKITFYPDRPDVMTIFSVRIEAPADLPVLLSNGDPEREGEMENGRRFAEWSDPWPKPAYLFALVAGDLVAHRDTFTTRSGREVALAIHVRPGDEDKCAYAMDALKRSMTWDEEVYGLEYDLDVFNIVATDDFNMGAMENKGLNIFNSKYVLASPETATDRDYELIESIIAHEYFHNWTGNRITCRDWFQLCLKEGLTVFRDQQFSADMRSAAVQRIEDVKALRARQFREDQGPLAHPVRPTEYIEINNFYTATVYEKGAEVIGMLRALVGAEGYRKALDLYFARHDGQACTIEQFRACFEDACGVDLAQFALWWEQSGVPRLAVEERWDSGAGRLELAFRQETPPTPGQSEKAPQVLPIRVGLLSSAGEDLLPETSRILVMTGAEQSFAFDGLAERPVASLLRGFSAPVILAREIDDATRAFLLAHDSDPFAKWEAGRAYAVDAVLRLLGGAAPETALFDALGAMATDARLDPAFRATALETPGEDEIAREVHARGRPADPDAIRAALEAHRAALTARIGDRLRALYDEMRVEGAYAPDAGAAGRRALRNRCLALLAAGGGAALDAAAAQFDGADNMTDSMAALTVLVHAGAPAADAALERFHSRWKDTSLVVDKWLMVQATAPRGDALERVEALTRHPAFSWSNPNKFRSLIGAFALANPSQFHRADGAGYRFFTDWLLKLDGANPQTAARLAGAFETWRRYDEDRQNLMRAEIGRILAHDGLSRDLTEMAGRIAAA